MNQPMIPLTMRLLFVLIFSLGAMAADGAAQPMPAEPAAPKFTGVMVDDDAAEFTGDWVDRPKQPALVGRSYRHDDNREQGKKSARFTPDLPVAGQYEVRLIYVAHANRATNVSVTVLSADGEKQLTVNEREDVFDGGVPRALGVFNFEPGKKGAVIVSNAGANGYVVVDAVQFVPLQIAQAERAAARKGDIPGAFGRPKTVAAKTSPIPFDPELAARAKAEPVQLAKAAQPGDVGGKSYDLVVIEGTPSGVACAVRAAREGLSVLFVNHTRHLGGMMLNGLLQWDALYAGHRAPIFDEVVRNFDTYYRTAYGEKSHDYERARFTQKHYPLGMVEPHVAEREFNRLVAGEKNITLLLGHFPAAVERDGAMLRSVTLREFDGAHEVVVHAAAFADATYEGDLFALAKVPYRVGREAREEYHEPHAGKIFTNIAKGPAPLDAVEGRLNIHAYSSKQGSIDPASPFTADGAVQAYNYRFCVTCDPANRILIGKPANYEREEFLHFDRKGIANNPGPNSKATMNSPILPGENPAYPEADWPAREKIIRRHLDFALGLMWFLQNDESVPEAPRAKFREWGLPKDEYADHDHVPYEMYVREARRIVGRHVFTEHDNSLASGFARTPVMLDSVAITDWYMDSHSCTKESRPGFAHDGKLILTEESRPAQIPYRALLPQGVDNLLVPVCLSATHIAWGAVRLEPVLMETGEAVGLAATLAMKQKIAPAKLNADQLVRELCERRFMVSFFNDVDVRGGEAWIPMAEYFGTRGFFHDYNARMADGLKLATAKVWADGLAKLRAGKLDANALASAVAEAERTEQEATVADFAVLCPSAANATLTAPHAVITREGAMRRMWESLHAK
jgi:hypothetical protein